MKYISVFLLSLIVVLINPSNTQAITNPLSVSNNKYGIHVADPSNLDHASALLNSSGGDWGYVTIVIPQNERNLEKWQDIFDKMRRLHLIPIVRIATTLEGDIWKKPVLEDIPSWVDFLDSLNWVVKNRYVVLFNEPNHAKEWGGSINPEEYARLLSTFSDKLREKSADFFILPAGLDTSSPNSSNTLDMERYVQRMKTEVPTIFEKIDGWTSHSYPNPGFSGSPYSSGRGTIRSYNWELNLLKQLGLNRAIPVFITETGWPHKEGINYNGNYFSETQTSSFMEEAYLNAWNENYIVAITPFLLSYQSYPFDNFSWMKPDGTTFYQQYETLKSLPKTKGEPIQIQKVEFSTLPLPQKLITESTYSFVATVLNSGQSIFDKSQNAHFEILTKDLEADISTEFFIEPPKSGHLEFTLKTPKFTGKFPVTLLLKYKNEIVDRKEIEIEVVTPPSLTFKISQGLNPNTTDQNFTILVYDDEERPIVKFSTVELKQGQGQIVKLKDVAVGKEYRIVIQKPYYLPRQEILAFKEKENFVQFKPLLPLDLDLDGKFTLNDYWLIVFHPIFTLSLVFSPN